VTLPVRVRAPATTANLGPGFDCAGAALDLWNEMLIAPADTFQVAIEGEGAAELPGDSTHLAIRAYAELAPTDGLRFEFVNRIPLARGLGSSASAIALGVVGAAFVSGRELGVEELLAVALRFEQHPDNLAPALAGGVCLSWPSAAGQRIARVADALPLSAIAVVPSVRVETAAARDALPAEIPHADAAFSAGRATLLGAAAASGSAELFTAALADRLHEPYRGPLSPIWGPLRQRLPQGAAGLTISGSGPTVIVWTRAGEEEPCEVELHERFADVTILRLGIASTGAIARHARD
jgi:homoserine kinase